MSKPAVSKAFLRSVGVNVPVSKSRLLRAKLLKKDPYCYYCGCPLDLDGSTLDHTIPKSKGGTYKHAVLACSPCNQAKGDKIIMPWNILRNEK